MLSLFTEVHPTFDDRRSPAARVEQGTIVLVTETAPAIVEPVTVTYTWTTDAARTFGELTTAQQFPSAAAARLGVRQMACTAGAAAVEIVDATGRGISSWSRPDNRWTDHASGVIDAAGNCSCGHPTRTSNSHDGGLMFIDCAHCGAHALR